MSSPPTDELFEAIRAGDEAAVRSALARDADPNQTRSYSTVIDRDRYEGTTSPLMAAVSAAQPKIVRLLLQAGANPNLADELSGRTPLIEAAARVDAESVEALLGAGAGIEARDALSYENALTAAVKSGDKNIAERLVRAGAKPEPPALDAAMRLDRVDLAELLISAGLALDTTKGLSAAATYGRTEMLRWLVARGADLERQGPEALHAAANGGNTQVVLTLLDLGVPVEARTSYGWTPLHLAAYNGTPETVRALLERGADPRAKDGKEKTALDWAQDPGKDEKIALLRASLKT